MARSGGPLLLSAPTSIPVPGCLSVPSASHLPRRELSAYDSPGPDEDAGHIGGFVRPMGASPHRNDPRRTATRRALLDSFFIAVLSTPYEDISVEALARRAGVSRSTFYANFAGKNALLAASLRGAVLDHFWENRARARGLFSPGLRGHIVDVLARLIEKRLARRVPLLLPRRLASRQLADSLLSPVIAWVLGEVHCPAPRLAQALRAAGRGLIDPLRVPPLGGQ